MDNNNINNNDVSSFIYAYFKQVPMSRDQQSVNGLEQY